MTDDKKKKKRRRKKREEGKRGTSRMFYFHLHDNESFREGRKEEGESELIRLERAKFRIRRLLQRVGIIKTTEGKCFRAGGEG